MTSIPTVLISFKEVCSRSTTTTLAAEALACPPPSKTTLPVAQVARPVRMLRVLRWTRQAALLLHPDIGLRTTRLGTSATLLASRPGPRPCL